MPQFVLIPHYRTLRRFRSAKRQPETATGNGKIKKEVEEFFAGKSRAKIPMGQLFRSGDPLLQALPMCAPPGLYVRNSCTILRAAFHRPCQLRRFAPALLARPLCALRLPLRLCARRNELAARHFYFFVSIPAIRPHN